MRNDFNGVSVCSVGCENYEKFYNKCGARRNWGTFYQYDFRDEDGTLFTVVKRTLEECRAARDAWLEKKRS